MVYFYPHFAFVWFVFGLAWGSFANVWQQRLKKPKKSQARVISPLRWVDALGGRSKCDGCGRQLSWVENIPVFSWIIQRGRANCCGTPLGWQYPVVELCSGIVFMLYYLAQKVAGSMLAWDYYWGIVVLMIIVVIVAVDLWQMLIPDEALVGLVALWGLRVVVLVWRGNGGELVMWENMLAVVGGGGFLLLLYTLTKGQGMGFGDVKLACVMGLFLGKLVVVAMYTAFISGAVLGIILLAFRVLKRRSPIPFGPFLCLGWLVAWLYF